MLLTRIIEFMPRWARWSTAAVALVMPVVVFTHGYEIKLAAKAAWSRWDVERAKPLLENEITAQEGVHLLLKALMRSPDEPEVIRSLARLTDEAGMPVHARFFYEHLARRNALTAEDKLRHAATLARLHDHTGAQIALQKIKQVDGETPALWRTEAEIAMGKGDHASARAALTKVLAQVPQDDVAELQQAKTRAFSAETGQKQAGINQLLDLFEESLDDLDSNRRTQCFWALSSKTIDDAAQRERFARLIGRMPWKKLERRVMQRLLEWSLDETDASGAKLQDWLHQMFASESDAEAEERLAVAKMLQRQGLHLPVLEWISFDMALKDNALCAARVDSLVAVKLWAEAAATVDHPSCPLPPVLKAIIRAQLELTATGGKTLKSGVLLGDALGVARQHDNQGAFIAIARLAAQFAHHEVALMAYREALAPRFPVALFLADAFIAEARQAGGPADVVLTCLSRRLDEEAWNEELRRQVRYYRVLCGHELELVEAEAWQIRRQHPQDVYSVFLAAFARLRLGQTQNLATFLPLLAEPHDWTAGERAALHAICHAAGDAAAAASFREGIPPDAALLAEEVRLLAVPR